MSHFDIIIITTGSLFISSVFGFYALKYIHLCTRPPVNTLIRSSRDIELQSLEPSRNNSLDLFQVQPVYAESIPVRVPSSNTLLEPQPVYICERVHNSWSSNPSTNITPSLNPSTNITRSLEESLNLQRIPDHFYDLKQINSCLEDSINLNYIWLFIILLILLILLFLVVKGRIKEYTYTLIVQSLFYFNKMFFLISIALLIFSNMSLLDLIPFILSVSTFILSSLNLITDRNNFISRLIQLISLIFIIYIISLNIYNIYNFNYWNDPGTNFDWIIYWMSYKYRRSSFIQNERTKFCKSLDGINDIKNSFIDKLNNNQIYLLKIEYQFLMSNGDYQNHTMSWPILITNQVNCHELIAHINNEITFLIPYNKLNDFLSKHWEDELIIQITYYELYNFD